MDGYLPSQLLFKVIIYMNFYTKVLLILIYYITSPSSQSIYIVHAQLVTNELYSRSPSGLINKSTS